MKSNSSNLNAISQIVLKHLVEYFSQSQKGKGKTLIQRSPQSIAQNLEVEKYIREGIPNLEAIESILLQYLDNTQHLHHPQYIGHQVGIPNIGSSIADFVHGVTNNPMAIYEMGPAGATIEKVVVNWMLEKATWFKGRQLGEFDDAIIQGGGILTHGGSMANLTVLLAARAKANPDIWTEGNDPNLVVLAPAVSHYSVAKSLSIMGMGSKSVIPVPVNDLEVLKVEELNNIYQKIKAEGKKVMAVVANACATSTGLYDPIEEVGLFCKENDLWFHVDGAHGAAALVSPNERHLLKGIELADSLIWDAHKMLRTSALCAAALFKDHTNLDRAFKQKGSYIFFDQEQIGFDLISNAIECTKSGLGTKLFWSIVIEGEKGMSDFVEKQYAKGKEFYEIIQAHPDFECPYFPESNVLCFRYTKGKADNAYQLAIRNEIVKQGNFYITSAVVNDVRYLRLSIMNPLTNKEHIEELLEAIVDLASEK